MSIPGYQALMLPLLQMAGEGEIALQDAVQRLIERFNLTPEIASQRLPSGQTVIYNRTGWAKTELVKAGLIEQPRRGLFRITDRGRTLLANPPAAISRAYLVENYPEFRAYIEVSQQRQAASAETTSVSSSELSAEPAGATPDELIDTAAKTLTAALEADLLERIRAVHPTQFDRSSWTW